MRTPSQRRGLPARHVGQLFWKAWGERRRRLAKYTFGIAQRGERAERTNEGQTRLALLKEMEVSNSQERK